uniref:Tripartite motif-containing protein 7-like isoform X2 n=1 Tax=Crassostrea virginica TaxID=6565 RepID=A0A8B8B270_CRAVI|nr:tripartite motif-containing protein 7-like isoform X2 [Crassostrea virginica]
MNPSKSAQDVLRCHLCETPVPPLCCDICHIYLCKVCAGEHILDESTGHKVVPIKQTLTALIYPTCSNHSTENCQLYSEDCTTPACVQCVTYKDHKGHGFIDLIECVERKKEASQKNLQELKSSILIEHKEFASHIRNQKSYLDKTLQELKTAIDEHGEKLHKQVSDVVEKLKSDIVKKHEERIAALINTEEKNAITISDIENCILGVQELQASRDIGRVFEYKSRNEELRKTPPNLNVTLPTFVAYDITNDKLNELFGSLTMESDDRKTLEQDVKSMSLKAKDVERDEVPLDGGPTGVEDVIVLSKQDFNSNITSVFITFETNFMLNI